MLQNSPFPEVLVNFSGVSARFWTGCLVPEQCTLSNFKKGKLNFDTWYITIEYAVQFGLIKF
jgi:hypothetical protein